jgi:hypothetical protein
MNQRCSNRWLVIALVAGLWTAGCMHEASEPFLTVETRVDPRDEVPGKAPIEATRAKAESAPRVTPPQRGPNQAPVVDHHAPEPAPRQGGNAGQFGNAVVEIPSGEIRPGMLTAGSIDDNERYEDYQSYLAGASFEPGFPRVSLGQRVMIRVTNARGKGLGDARLTIRPAPFQASDRGVRGAAPAELTTGSDGRAIFLTALDAPGLASAELRPGTAFLVTVQPPDGTPPITHTFSLVQPKWEIRLATTAQRLPKHLDVALAIDTTGSMSDELEYLKVEIDSIAAEIARQFPDVEARFALVAYRDEGEPYVTRALDFCILKEFRQRLQEERAVGGGDYPEAVHTALAVAADFSWRTQDTARMLFLVGDAPPHDEHAQKALAQAGRLRKLGVRIFPVAASGVSPRAEYVFRAAAMTTLGQYLFLTDHSGVGSPHAAPQTAAYRVERLDELLVRLIASELSGERIAPQHVLAVGGSQGTPLGQSTTTSVSVRTTSSWSLLDGSGARWAVLGLALVWILVVDGFGRRRGSAPSA